jgi:TPR repeat protein
LACRLCKRWWKRLWAKTEAWERWVSNESELWSKEPDRNRELIGRAGAIRESDPAAALELYRQAAEAGSPYAMETVAWCYWTGTGTASNFYQAAEYYRRAVAAGSWPATIGYARLVWDHGLHDESDRVLREGVAAGFVPSYFWLAYLGLARSRNRELRREIRELLEYAAGKGHPAAKVHLARAMITGKFGLRAIPAGLVAAARVGEDISRGFRPWRAWARRRPSGRPS